MATLYVCAACLLITKYDYWCKLNIDLGIELSVILQSKIKFLTIKLSAIFLPQDTHEHLPKDLLNKTITYPTPSSCGELKRNLLIGTGS